MRNQKQDIVLNITADHVCSLAKQNPIACLVTRRQVQILQQSIEGGPKILPQSISPALFLATTPCLPLSTLQ